MKNEDKTREQLVRELDKLRRKISAMQSFLDETSPDTRARLEKEDPYRRLLNNLPNVVFKGNKDWTVEIVDHTEIIDYRV